MNTMRGYMLTTKDLRKPTKFEDVGITSFKGISLQKERVAHIIQYREDVTGRVKVLKNRWGNVGEINLGR